MRPDEVAVAPMMQVEEIILKLSSTVNQGESRDPRCERCARAGNVQLWL